MFLWLDVLIVLLLILLFGFMLILSCKALWGGNVCQVKWGIKSHKQIVRKFYRMGNDPLSTLTRSFHVLILKHIRALRWVGGEKYSLRLLYQSYIGL